MEKLKCYGCNDRYPGCHGKCEYYIEWKKKHDEERIKVNKLRAEETGRIQYKINVLERLKKR